MTYRPARLPEGLLGEAAVLLIFDGWCGVCTRFADWVRARDAGSRVLALPNQTAGLPLAAGLTEADVDREAWAIARDGRVYAGAAAINRTLHELGGGWRLVARLYALPGLRWAEDLGYRWFARHRGRFARWGVTPECERPKATSERAR